MVLGNFLAASQVCMRLRRWEGPPEAEEDEEEDGEEDEDHG